MMQINKICDQSDNELLTSFDEKLRQLLDSVKYTTDHTSVSSKPPHYSSHCIVHNY